MSRYSDTGIAPMTDEERRLQMADLFVFIRPAWAGGDYTKAFHALQEILSLLESAPLAFAEDNVPAADELANVATDLLGFVVNTLIHIPHRQPPQICSTGAITGGAPS